MIQLPPHLPGWQNYVKSYEEFLVGKGKSSEDIIREVQELIDEINAIEVFEARQVCDAIMVVLCRSKVISAPKMSPQHNRIIVPTQNPSPEPIIIKNEPNCSGVKNEPVVSEVQSEQEKFDAVRVKKRKRGDENERTYIKKRKTNEQFSMMQPQRTVNLNGNGHEQVKAPYMVNAQQQVRMQPQQQAPSQLQHLLQVKPPQHVHQQVRSTPQQQQTLMQMRLQQQRCNLLQQQKRQELRMQEEKLKQKLRMEAQQHSEQMVQQKVQVQPQPQQQQFDYQQGDNYLQQNSNYSPVAGNSYLNQQFNYPSTSGTTQQQISHSRAQMQSPPQQDFGQQEHQERKRKLREEKLNQELRLELQQHSEQMVQKNVQVQPQPQQQQIDYQQGDNFPQRYSNHSPVAGNFDLNQQLNYPSSSGMTQQQISHSRAQMHSPPQQIFEQQSTSPYPHVNHQYQCVELR